MADTTKLADELAQELDEVGNSNKPPHVNPYKTIIIGRDLATRVLAALRAAPAAEHDAVKLADAQAVIRAAEKELRIYAGFGLKELLSNSSHDAVIDTAIKESP